MAPDAGQKVDVPFSLRQLGRYGKTKYPSLADQPDEDVGRYLKSKFPDRFKDVQEQTTPQPPPEAPSAGSRFMSNVGQQLNPMPTVRLAERLRHEAVANPKEAAKDIKATFWDPQVDMFRKSAEAFGKGDYIDWFGYSLAGALPGAGPSIMHGYEQMKQGDVAGGAGTWTGVVAPFLAHTGSAAALEKISSKAPKVYERALKWDEGVSLDKRAEISRRGLGRQEPPGAPQPPPTVAKESSLAQLKARDVPLRNEVASRIHAATASGIDIDRDYVLKPLEDLAAKFKKSANSKHAKPIQDLVDQFRSEHGQFISPDDLQELKENTDRILKDPVFAEGAKIQGTAGGEKVLRDQMQQMLQQVADVQDYNRAIHLDIGLQDAINQALKTRPNLINELAPYVIGDAAIRMGHGGFGATIVTGALIRHVLRSPQAMTRLAIMLDRAGVKVPKYLAGSGFAISPVFTSPINAERKEKINREAGDIMIDLAGSPNLR